VSKVQQEIKVPVEPLTPDILTCSVFMNGPLSLIEPLFPVEHLSPEILPCTVLMNGPLSPIEHTEQDNISGVKGSTGNKGSIGYKGPSGNTEQGNLSDDKGTTGNINVLLVTKDRSSIQSKDIWPVLCHQYNIYYLLNLCHLRIYLHLY
jgi:hypothetical protein